MGASKRTVVPVSGSLSVFSSPLIFRARSSWRRCRRRPASLARQSPAVVDDLGAKQAALWSLLDGGVHQDTTRSGAKRLRSTRRRGGDTVVRGAVALGKTHHGLAGSPAAARAATPHETRGSPRLAATTARGGAAGGKACPMGKNIRGETTGAGPCGSSSRRLGAWKGCAAACTRCNPETVVLQPEYEVGKERVGRRTGAAGTATRRLLRLRSSQTQPYSGAWRLRYSSITNPSCPLSR